MSMNTYLDDELAARFEGSGDAEARRHAAKKQVAYKTVDTFSGITRRKLWLKDGESAHTDGHSITVPFSDPDFYQLTEHEIAHVLFGSDAIAREKFLDDYVSRVEQVTKKAGVNIDAKDFRTMMAMMINIVEDNRINSLWGQLYPGSYKKLQSKIHRETAPYAGAAEQSLLAYMSCKYAGIPVAPCKFDRFGPFVMEALKKVERKGFGSTLAATKWLVTQLVSDLIRQVRNQEAASDPNGDEESDGNGGGGGDAEADCEGGGSGTGGSGGSGESDSESENQGSGGGGGQWYPPPVDDASLEQRAKALKDLLGDGTSRRDRQAAKSADDFQAPRFPTKQDNAAAEKIAAQVTAMDVNKPEVMQEFQAAAEAAMDAILDRARTSMRQEMNEDDWLTKDAMAKVVFKDIAKNVGEKVALLAEDSSAVQRLRSQFFRVMGKKKTALTDTGSEIDMAAYIEMRATKQAMPIFKHEERGQGFKALILVDRSGSMAGPRTASAERACRIISKAMHFPFVNLQVWGFKSSQGGQVDIDRFNPQTNGYSSSAADVGGTTPLHVATKVACRYLEDGDEAKHLFVITDGFPVYSRRDGTDFPTWQLMMYTRESLVAARRAGVGVTGILLGEKDYEGKPAFDLTPKQMGFMFGHARNWRMMDSERLGTDLVRLVSSSFTDYLSAR